MSFNSQLLILGVFEIIFRESDTVSQSFFQLLFPLRSPSYNLDILQHNNKEGVQGLQVFAFCLLIVNNEHTKQA